MGRSFIRSAIVLLATAFLSSACGQQGSYELRWTIGCKTPDDRESCALRSVKECSQVGLDSVEVFAQQGSAETRSVFPCFSDAEGAMGRGPELETGDVTLQIYGLSPGGQKLIGPLAVETTIPSSGFVLVDVDLPRPPACNDGVDNDGDGLVDLHDPDCKDPNDTSE